MDLHSQSVRGGKLASKLKRVTNGLRLGASKHNMGGPPARPQRRLDRSKSAAAGALRGLQLATKYVIDSWPVVEKRFETLAVDRVLVRSRFGKCIGKQNYLSLKPTHCNI
jgi:respiratory burst oxidase